MLFNSFHYFLFLPAVFLVFYFTRQRLRWLVLLLSSYCFYAALLKPYLLLALAVVTLITYRGGILIASAGSEHKKKRIFWISLTANILVLFFFKYLSFFVKNLDSILNIFAFIPASLHLPIPILESLGVSYYTFQAISYLIDIYLEKDKPEKHFGYFALYLGFFPKLLQGPIERSENLLPQIRSGFRFNYASAASGLFLFAVGLFKKVVIADHLAKSVNYVYGDVHSFTGVSFLSATLFYSFQIYYDFSGYTDMALGAAALFNIKLTQNFKNPYLATSVADFWRRWHISFSTWLLDYVFRPLQMRFRQFGNYGSALALMVAFLVCGIWHGAKWTFIIWGMLHGIYLSVSVLTRKPRERFTKLFPSAKNSRLKKSLETIITFSLVSFAWIFFRADSTEDAFYIVRHLFTGVKGLLFSLSNLHTGQGRLQLILLGQNWHDFLCVVFAVIFIEIIHRQQKEVDAGIIRFKNPVWLKWSIYYLLILGILYFWNLAEPSEFIYFQF